MFLHWLAGMIFIFYFASFVVLLREVFRPRVLWFLRNLNDQNFHPIQDVSHCMGKDVPTSALFALLTAEALSLSLLHCLFSLSLAS